jgi:tRNA threonylcarbamoyladenosine biosynthesis protein TsaB
MTKAKSILAIETATQVCGVALLESRVLIAEQRIHIRNIHARQITQSIDHILAASGMELKDLDAFAVSIGPGSFTGLRIGLAIAKGMAMPHDIPLIPVPTLAALASQAPVLNGLVCPILKAKADEYFAALYEKQIKNIRLTQNVTLIKREELAAFLPSPALLIGHVSELPDNESWQKAPELYNLTSAYSCGLLADKLWETTELPDMDTLEPTYYQDFIAGKPKNILSI